MAKSQAKVAAFRRSINSSSKNGKQFNQRMVEGSRAVDDISAGFATAGFNAQGFALALRGAQNNVTTMLAVTNPLAAAITGVAFAAGAIFVKRLAQAGKATESLKEKTDELTESIERLAKAQRSKAGLGEFRGAFDLSDEGKIGKARTRLAALQNRALAARGAIGENKAFLEDEANIKNPGLKALSKFGRLLGSFSESAPGNRAAAAKAELETITPEINKLTKALADLEQSNNKLLMDRKNLFRRRDIIGDSKRFGSQLASEFGVVAKTLFGQTAIGGILGSGAGNALRNEGIRNLLAAQKKPGGPITDRFAAAITAGGPGSRAAQQRGRFAFKGQDAAKKTADNTAKLIELLRIKTT
jgi:hypothetical protein